MVADDARLWLIRSEMNEKVSSAWGTDAAVPPGIVRTSDLVPGDFPAGSMRPTVEADINFARTVGKSAAIGRLEDTVEIVAGIRGTWIEPVEA